VEDKEMHHKDTKNTKAESDRLSFEILGSALEVHRTIGPGLLESAYEECLAYEFSQRGLAFKRQIGLPQRYKAGSLDCGYRLDFLVESPVVVELKAVERVLPIHQAQVLTYLRMSSLWLGLLLNFNVRFIRSGIQRLVI
jgi:GxxExxY protein